MLNGDYLYISLFKKTFNMGFFSNTSKARSFKLWIFVLCSLNIVWLLHTLKRLLTIWPVWLWCVFKGDNFFKKSVRCLGRVKNFNTGILLRHHKCYICQNLHGGTTHWALAVHTTFSDLDCISRSQQCETV